MLLIGGSSDAPQEQLGAFQECTQVEAARLFTKFTARPPTLERIPAYVAKAVRMSTYGRPGAVYLDFPGDLLSKTVPVAKVQYAPRLPAPPTSLAPDSEISRAIELLRKAERPLVITGKGAAYGRAENSIQEFIRSSDLPFLPTAMGKGLLPDDHPNCVSPARSLALQKADVILLLGARLNWMLHFGQPPRFNPNIKIIQVSISAYRKTYNKRPPPAILKVVFRMK
jgi:2-hydroxyacyl-CoA lyase 1